MIYFANVLVSFLLIKIKINYSSDIFLNAKVTVSCKMNKIIINC